MDDKRSHHVQVRTIDKVNEYDEKEGENSQENENNGENIRLPSNTGIPSSNTSSQQSRMTFFGRWTGAAETSNEPSSGSSPPSHNIPTQRNTIARVLNRFASSTTPMQNNHPSGNRHTFLRMFSTRHPARSTPASSTTNRRMLTYGQLSDLFRRLDKDGNGELDLEEFTQIINKLKINATEDFVARIFRKVDVAQSGTLNIQEFISAYQMIFTRPASFVGNNLPDKRGKKLTEFVCAVRYGLDLERGPIYEIYFGTVIDLEEGPYLVLEEKRIYKISNVDDVADMECEVSRGLTMTLGDLNELIVRDSMNNKMGRSKVYWWIDIAMYKVASARVDKYIAAFGLPNDAKFRSAFGQFGTCLPKEEKNHVYSGNGTSNLGGVSSLSFFVQALWILNLPIVHHLPAWLDSALESYVSPSISASLKNYYYSRFAFLLSSSVSNSSRAEEFATTYDTAQSTGNKLIDERDEDDDDDFTRTRIGPPDKINSNILLPAPSSGRQAKWKTEPTWLIAGNELKKRPPRLQFDDLGLHLLNQGHGTSSLITIREIDDEKDEKEVATANNKKNDFETILQDSKCGIIGRILTNIRICILKNLSRDGIVSVAGELTDSPGALAAVMMTLVHSFSMNTQVSLEGWLTLISTGVDELAVSKHSAHAKELGGIIHLLLDYVQPTHQIFEKLYKEGAQTLADEALAEEQAALLAEQEAFREESQREHLESIGDESSSSSNSSGDNDQGTSTMSSSIQTQTRKSLTARRPSVLKYSRKFSAPPLPKKPPQRKSVTLRRRTGLTAEIQLSSSTLSPGVETIPIDFSIIRVFLGNTACQHLGMVLDGDESLEVKGTKYWSERLNTLHDTYDKVKEDIRISLDEKRNFFSFILTVVTVGLAPLTILTSYWGMNFKNMAELDPNFLPDVPGVKLMWVTAFFIYCAFLIMSIHLRIIYSAT